ncbi:MAG: ATP-binding cassette domain-containing protein, partial [Armatimonadetes bacterium]|nr:ATP-binding cassette domain-containing protein [Armatimonadota bacterium]
MSAIPSNEGPATPILSVRGLKKHFHVSRQMGMRRVHEVVRAVDGIDLDVPPGATVGLVGESGCGKSTAGRTILRLLQPTAGSVRFDGTDLATVPARDLRRLRRRMGIVFQDPMF